jgi:ATP-dependent DNA helicase DinG
MDSLKVSEVLNNFAFKNVRHKQTKVIEEICNAFNSGYKYIILEAPTGFGKSAVGIAVAKTLGSSYVCTATKDLQTQYARDFPFLKLAKGKNNFPCKVKEDFVMVNKYKCGGCPDGTTSECKHISCDYGPCLHDESMEGTNCRYRTILSDYKVINEGRINENVILTHEKKEKLKRQYSEWLHTKTLGLSSNQWAPCYYFDQLNCAILANHSIFNYSIFLSLLPNKNSLPTKELLILDEGHLIETEVVKFRGLSISKRRWKRYIPDFEIIDYGYDINGWIEFLIKLEEKILSLIGNASLIKSLADERKSRYGYKGSVSRKQKRVISASQLFESDDDIEKGFKVNEMIIRRIGEEILVEIFQDLERLTRTINNILTQPRNWIVAEVHREKYEVTRVDLKPLDTSPYCRSVFEKCHKSIIMSATILNNETFARNIGFESAGDVKFIRAESDFPIENRPIFPLGIAYLNFQNLQKLEVQIKISKAIDNIMHIHKNEKGIVHTTSYEQLAFIKGNISTQNARRLLVTDPDVERDEVIREHVQSKRPTVLISPSLHTGLDLKDGLSRFQVITKIPYPNTADRWISAKRIKDESWYYLQTGLRLIQGYGRSIRSKEDWAKTYILDSAFDYFVKKNRKILPDWFVAAIRY